MEFQVIDWYCRDEKSNRLVDDNTINETYVIHMFGCNADGNSVHIKVKNFKPYFFIKVPKWFKKRHVDIFQEFLKEQIYYKHKENIVSCSLQKRMDFNGYHPEPDKFVVVHFHNLGAWYSLKRLFKDGQLIKTIPELSSMPLRFNSYEANLDPMLRFIHITDIKPAGWIHVDKFTKGKFANTSIDVETDWMHIHPHDHDGVAPLKQASFDIECTAGDGISFPEYNNINDPVIQIGTTVYIYGKDNSKPIKHIICLGQTDDISGAIVESYETEKEVLLAWTKFIRKLDPDILTGYNIYGFDFRYLFERAKLLGIEEKFSLLGRLKGEHSVLYEKKLSSSALGFNEMHILPMIGRLEIDLFKVIQRDYKFESYKLDAVSAEFIKGKVSDVKQTKTYTNLVGNASGLNVGNYISILANGYKYITPEGKKKFKILAIKGDRIRIEKIEKPEGKLQWCLAKDDVSPKDIFKLQKGSSSDRSIVAAYCLQDNILCNELMDKLDIITNHIGMANVCSVPLSFLFLRGQGIKAYSLVARQCRLEKYLMPDLRKTRESEYQGATVLDAQVGAHFYPVACNDFASLYPSSMISHNLSPDTWISDPKYLRDTKYHTIKISENEKYHFVLPEETAEEDKHNPEVQKNRKGRGILPRILIKLLQERKDVKKKMAKETDPFKKRILDGLQLSIKLTCNSFYGQCGSSVSAIACKPVSASTTSIGRELLEMAGQKALETFPGSELVYGDSVMPYTPLLLRNPNSGKVMIKTIETLSQEWSSYEEFKPFDTIESNRREKEQAKVNLEVWSKDGWNPIKRVIRHKCNKEIFRVNTHCGVIDVTEDHSLMYANGEKCKPGNCIIGETELKQSYPSEFQEFISIIKGHGKKPIISENTKICTICKKELNISKFYLKKKKYTLECKNCYQIKYVRIPRGYSVDKPVREQIKVYYEDYEISEDEAFIWGFFMGDGSCGSYNTKWGIKYTWALNNNDIDRLKKILDKLHNYEHIKFKILDTLKSSGVYKLVPIKGIKYMVDKYRKLFYDKDKYKIIPDIILNGPKNIRKAYLKGYYEADGSKTHSKGINKSLGFCCKGQIGAAQLYYLCTSLGYNMNLYITDKKPEIFWLSSSIKSIQKENVIKKLYSLGKTDNFVYDLETEKGTFHGGIGEICLFNTDSCFVKYPLPKSCKTKKEKLEHAMKCAKVVEKVVSGELPWPHNFEYEKIYFPYILYSKKRYSGVMYEFDLDNYSKIDNKGIVLKRRDNAKIVKYIFGGCLNIILHEQDVEKALKFLKDSIDKMFRGEFDIGMFVISKALKTTSTIKNKCDRFCNQSLHVDHIHPLQGINPATGRAFTAPPAQGLLAIRMAKRDQGNAPQWNDRIPYVYIYVDKEKTREMLNEYNKDIVDKKKKRKTLLQGDLIEHPDYVQANQLPLDYLFYLTNQLTNPLAQLFGIFENVDGDLEAKEKAFKKRVIKPLEMKYKNKQDGIRTLDCFFKKK